MANYIRHATYRAYLTFRPPPHTSASQCLLQSLPGGEPSSGGNLNFFLEQYGIAVNSDCVVRVAMRKYFHPKECLIADGVVNRALLNYAGVAPVGGEQQGTKPGAKGEMAFSGEGLEFVYPYGATMNVQKPATALLSTGKVAYPMKRPVGGWERALVGWGRGSRVSSWGAYW